MNKIERALFILLLVTIPIQLGKHFWPAFSFVQGIRVDYLSPTLYLSDIFIILLILVSIKRLQEKLLAIIATPIFFYSLTILLLGSFLSVSPLAALFALLKIFEFAYVAFYVAHIHWEKIDEGMLFALTLGGLVEVIILAFQFYAQSSIGGLFYFLGERTFSVSTIGIATFQLGKTELLRPYGTFPHPNVAAYYLLFVYTFLLFSLKNGSPIISKLKFIALSVIFIGILLTFSRVVILLLLFTTLLGGLRLVKGKRRKKEVVALFIAGLLLLVPLLFSRFINSFLIDIVYRLELLKISFSIFLKNPFLGIGLNNFFNYEAELQKNITPTFLQPVHNIFILWICQTGLFGGVIVLYLAKLISVNLKNILYPVAVLCVSSGVVGLFDHYLLTLHQGQLLFAILIGMALVGKARYGVGVGSERGHDVQ